MASSGSSQLAALCAVTSFIWLSQNVENHQLIGKLGSFAPYYNIYSRVSDSQVSIRLF